MSQTQAIEVDAPVDPEQSRTRTKLLKALNRLQRGTPRKVKKGTPVTPTGVAREAEVERSTLYRFHEPVLDQIRKATNKQLTVRVKDKQTTITELREKLKELVALTEAAQANVITQARIIHRQEHRIKELEDKLKARDDVIKRYQGRPVAR